MPQIIMPTELTTENGAKHAFLGEFHENITISCMTCSVDGYLDDGTLCHDCEGMGFYSHQVPVSWTTIKAIYKKAVELLGQEI